MKWNEEITVSAELCGCNLRELFERETGTLVWHGTPCEFWARFPRLLPDFGRLSVDSTDESREMDDVPLLALHAEFVEAATAQPCDRHYGCQWYEALCSHCTARSRLAAGIVWAEGHLADGTQVSYSSGWPTRCRTYWLIAPAKQGTLAVVGWDQDPQVDGDPCLRAWFTRTEAREQARKDREARRVAQAAYEVARQGAGDVLRNGGGLTWHLGQEGGTVEFGGVRVSARGAMVAAGMPRDTIDQWWEPIREIEQREERLPRIAGEPWSCASECRPGTWTLYADGAVYRVADGTVYSFGGPTELPRQIRIRDPRAGKRGDRRAERRTAKVEIEMWV